MSIFDLKQKTIRDDNWPEGDEVVIQELTYGEATRIANVAMSDVTMGEASNEESLKKIRMEQIDLGRPNLETMKACIVSWTFKRNGKVAPITIENIAALPAAVGDFILEEINALNPEPDDKFQGKDTDVLSDEEGKSTS